MRRRTAMNKIEMERLFERLLNEPDSTDKDSTGVERAALFRALMQARESGQIDGDEAYKLAAYLDGTLDSDEMDTFVAGLAGAPAEIYELESADVFLDAVSSEESTAPAELVAAAVMNAQRAPAKSVIKRSRFLSSASWGRQL